MRASSLSGLSRRAAVLAAGAFGASAVLAPSTKASSRKKANKRCKSQFSQCQETFAHLCDPASDCERFAVCCKPLGTCDFKGFSDCVKQLQGPN